jgi:hypothetical protein
MGNWVKKVKKPSISGLFLTKRISDVLQQGSGQQVKGPKINTATIHHHETIKNYQASNEP